MRKKFEYLRATSADEACALKAEYGASAQFLAGGTDLVLAWKRGVTQLDRAIDISGLADLTYMRDDGGEWCVGAATSLAAIAGGLSDNPISACMASTARQMATPQLRTTATIGGNVCHASPCADMAVILAMFDGCAIAQSTGGRRKIPVKEFFLGNKLTSLRDDELLVEVRMPIPADPSSAVLKRAHRTSVDLAQASAGVCLTAEDDRVVAARIAVGACAPVPVRPEAAEEMLLGMSISAPDRSVIEDVVGWTAAATSPICDVRAGDVYRRDVTRVLVRRAIDDCLTGLAWSAS